MNIRGTTIHDVYELLAERYIDMAKGTGSDAKIAAMMEAVVVNCVVWPADKTGRWLGYVQCLLIEVEKVTTVEVERNFTRPLFHHMYDVCGIKIPESIDI